MKNFKSIILPVIFATTACTKDPSLLLPPGNSLPFENGNLRIEVVSSSVPSFNIRDMHFFNESAGIVITYDGNIYKTADKGTTWTLKYTNPIADQPLFQVLFLDEHVGYVVGGADWCHGNPCSIPGGLVLKTTDGGETWAPVFQLAGETEFVSIAENNSGHLFLIANSSPVLTPSASKIWKSNDGGINWTLVDSLNFPLSKIIFHDGFGFCTGGYDGGKVIRSDDNGNTWGNTTSFGEHWTADIAFSDNMGYCMADNLSAYQTTDNGDTWTQVYHSPGYSSFKLDPLTDNSCLLWGSGAYTGGCFGYSYGAIRQTLNAGSDWSDIQFKDLGSIRCTSFYTTNEGYLLGGGHGGANLIKVTVKE